MGKKATKKFISSGQLKRTIEARHKSKQFKKKFQSRRVLKGSNGKGGTVDEKEDSDEEQGVVPKASSRYVELHFEFDARLKRCGCSAKRLTVDTFLSGNFMEESGEEDEDDDADVSSPS